MQIRDGEAIRLTVTSLLSEILDEFPDVIKSEIAEAFSLDDHVVRRLLRLARGVRQKRTTSNRKRPDMVQRVRAFAEAHCGGTVEIIPLVGDAAALCVNGRLVS